MALLDKKNHLNFIQTKLDLFFFTKTQITCSYFSPSIKPVKHNRNIQSSITYCFKLSKDLVLFVVNNEFFFLFVNM